MATDASLPSPGGAASAPAAEAGTAAVGAAASGAPLRNGGTDASGNMQDMKISTKGAVLDAPHNSDKATYVVPFNVAATASTDLFAIESGTTKIFRIRRIVILNPGLQTTAGMRLLQLLRTTAAGVGSAVTPAPCDQGDAAYTGLARSGNTGGNLGTAGTVLYDKLAIFVPTALATFQPVVIDFAGANCQIAKAPTGVAGIANGIALRDPGAAGGSGMIGYVELTEEAT